MEDVNKIPQKEDKKNDQFESDSQKIVHRHLENKDDIITDEDIKNVRVGGNPGTPDEVTLQRFDNEATSRTTPWDMIDDEE